MTCGGNGFELEADCVFMVTKLLLEGDDLSLLGVYTEAFRNLASSSALSRITSISRDVNKVADAIAKFACGMSQAYFQVGIVPDCIISIVNTNLVP